MGAYMSKKHLLEGFASDLSQGFGHVYAILSKYLPHIPTKNAYPQSFVTQHKVPTYATYTTDAQHEYCQPSGSTLVYLQSDHPRRSCCSRRYRYDCGGVLVLEIY